MEYMSQWNRIVAKVRKNCNVKEEIIQSDWETLFQFVFDYDESDIDAQRAIKFGSTKSGKPDIILRKGGKDLFVVELKRHTLHDGQEQLFSYLNQLKINLGIVVCDKLYLYDYDFAQKENAFAELEIPFEKNNADGAAFVELFNAQNFDGQKAADFIRSRSQTKNTISAIKSEITAELITDLLKEHFRAKYGVSDDAFEAAVSPYLITVASKMTASPQSGAIQDSQPIPVENRTGKTTATINGVSLLLYRAVSQSVQDFVKQTLATLFNNNLLSAQEISNLQDFRYSEKTFGLRYPLLQSDWSNCVISGHSRYWGDSPAKKIGGFYVCSQWWRENFSLYDTKIANWLLRLENSGE